LGGERDEDVLEAAREIHARITAADMTWEQLLVSEDGPNEPDDIDEPDDSDDADEFDNEETGDEETGDDDTGDDDTGDDDTGDEETGDEETGDEETGDDDESPDPEDEGAKPARPKDVESLALIEKLLAKSHISKDLREELKGYKTNIAEREFDARDRRYISAVHKRLSKRR
jgi:hypothetical protein